MSKTTIGAVIAAAGLSFTAGRLSTPASAKTPQPSVSVHALDLRAVHTADGGISVARVAYGTLELLDGGLRDVGAARVCSDSPARRSALADELKHAARECEWNF